MIPLVCVTHPHNTKVYRIVESQELVATMQLIDTLDEQAILEQAIEASKPTLPEHAKDATRHYLLTTLFRYPPLKHGSRFGRRHEPSLFYASHDLDAALSESAFYSFYFMSRTETPFDGVINNKKTSFSVAITTENYADLCALDDTGIQAKLQHKSDYSYPQGVGTFMRDEGIDVFSYFSTRHPKGKNLGIYYLNALKGSPQEELHWMVKQNRNTIMYICPSMTDLNREFTSDKFCVNGKLPYPSA